MRGRRQYIFNIPKQPEMMFISFIAQSLQQRKPESSSSIDDRLQMKAKANGLVTADQHNQLMDEFKKAHQKMFKNGENRSLDEDLVS